MCLFLCSQVLLLRHLPRRGLRAGVGHGCCGVSMFDAIKSVLSALSMCIHMCIFVDVFLCLTHSRMFRAKTVRICSIILCVACASSGRGNLAQAWRRLVVMLNVVTCQIIAGRKPLGSAVVDMLGTVRTLRCRSLASAYHECSTFVYIAGVPATVRCGLIDVLRLSQALSLHPCT